MIDSICLIFFFVCVHCASICFDYYYQLQVASECVRLLQFKNKTRKLHRKIARQIEWLIYLYVVYLKFKAGDAISSLTRTKLEINKWRKHIHKNKTKQNWVGERKEKKIGKITHWWQIFGSVFFKCDTTNKIE